MCLPALEFAVVNGRFVALSRRRNSRGRISFELGMPGCADGRRDLHPMVPRIAWPTHWEFPLPSRPRRQRDHVAQRGPMSSKYSRRAIASTHYAIQFEFVSSMPAIWNHFRSSVLVLRVWLRGQRNIGVACLPGRVPSATKRPMWLQCTPHGCALQAPARRGNLLDSPPPEGARVPGDQRPTNDLRSFDRGDSPWKTDAS